MSTRKPPVETQLANAVLIPREKIRAGSQPREHFDESKMQELADSIRAHGILQPLIVRYDPSRYDATPYVLVAGERRFRASEGILELLPCIVRRDDKESAAYLTFIENLQREDLTAIEEAKGLRDLMEAQNLTKREVARLLYVSDGYVNNRLALLDTAPDIQEVATRARRAMTSLVLIDKVKDSETRAELLEAVENETPHEIIKARVQAHLSDEKWKRDSQTPDRETSARIAAVAQNNGISTSRGKVATGNTSREAYETILDALTIIGYKTNTVEHWRERMTEAQKAKLLPAFRRLAETFKRFSESD